MAPESVLVVSIDKLDHFLMTFLLDQKSDYKL